LREIAQSIVKMRTLEQNITIGTKKRNVQCHDCEMVAYLREKVKVLKQQLNNTKIFLNMVIHEMRNPATSIEMALNEALGILSMQENKNKSPKKMSISKQFALPFANNLAKQRPPQTDL
jgi:hypothetical protein